MEAKTLLANYQREVEKIYPQIFAFWQREAQKAGIITQTILVKFFDLYPRGKQFRGALAVLGYELAGGQDRKAILEASVVLELMETAILIADDVFDQDEKRRGVATIHKQWEKFLRHTALDAASSPIQTRRSRCNTGMTKTARIHFGESMAQTTAIIGFHLALWVLAQAKFSEKIKNQVLKFYCESLIQTGFGEALDMASSWQSLKAKQGSAKLIHEYKTVRYSTVLPLKFGAIWAGKQDKIWLADLERYALALGRIFQIQDDIIGSFGDPKITGKANDSDIKEGRWTILMEWLWVKAGGADRDMIQRIMAKSQRLKAEVGQIKALMQKYQVVPLAQKKAQAYLQAGLRVMPNLTRDKKQQDTLTNLLRFMLERNK